MTLPDLTLFVFGVVIVGSGLTGLLAPNLLLSLLGLPTSESIPFVMACSQASVAMGLYYLLSAVHRNREFRAWSIPVRVFNFCIFTGMVIFQVAPPRWLLVAGLELVGALTTAWALASKRSTLVFDRFQALRASSIILAFLGGVLAFASFGIYGSASVFLVISSAGMIYAYRNFAPVEA